MSEPSDNITADVTLSFGARMRRERERRHISIQSIAESTKILGALLEAMENDDVSRWPTGFYRRAFMRAYASAIGLDADATVKEFLQRFPDPDEAATPTSALQASTLSAEGSNTAAGAFRVEVPEPGLWFTAGSLVDGLHLRLCAVALDFFVLGVAGVGLFAAFGTVWAPLAFAVVTYYASSILILGNTPGVCLFADPEKMIRRRGRLFIASRLPLLRAHRRPAPPAGSGNTEAYAEASSLVGLTK